VRYEILATLDVTERILDVFRTEILPHHRATVSIETVEVFKPEDFAAQPGQPRESVPEAEYV
jgi:hypothetical protein